MSAIDAKSAPEKAVAAPEAKRINEDAGTYALNENVKPHEREIPPVQAGFDYGALPIEIRADAKAAAERIRERFRHAYLQAGLDLIATKKALGHGHFVAWLKAEFDMTERSAERYMQCARWAEDKSDILSELTPSAVYQLAAPSTPPAVQEAVLLRAAAGERVKVAEINRLIADARQEARDEQRRAEDAAREAKLSPRTRQSRAQRQAEQEEQHQRWKLEQAEKEQATNEVADLLVSHLPPEAATRLRHLLRNWASYKIADALLERLKDAGDPPEPKSKPPASEMCGKPTGEIRVPAEGAFGGDPLIALQTQYSRLSNQLGAYDWVMRRLSHGETPAKDDNSEVAGLVRRFIAAPAAIQNQFRAGIGKRPVSSEAGDAARP
jgi:hypothetical protein